MENKKNDAKGNIVAEYCKVAMSVRALGSVTQPAVDAMTATIKNAASRAQEAARDCIMPRTSAIIPKTAQKEERDDGLDAVRRVLAFPCFREIKWPTADDFKGRLDNGKYILTKDDRNRLAAFARLVGEAERTERYAIEHRWESNAFSYQEKVKTIRDGAAAAFSQVAAALEKIPGAGRLAFGFRNLLDADNPAERLNELLEETDRFSADYYAGGGNAASGGADGATKTRKPNKGGRPTKDKECELTQEEAAMIVKESVSTIRNWDNGKHRPLGYPGRRDAAAFKLWANERDGKRELKESIKKASSLDNPRNPYSRMK